MNEFPLHKIVPLKAELPGKDNEVSIQVLLEPFDFNLGDYTERVETRINLDSIHIPIDLKLLEGIETKVPAPITKPERDYLIE